MYRVVTEIRTCLYPFCRIFLIFCHEKYEKLTDSLGNISSRLKGYTLLENLTFWLSRKKVFILGRYQTILMILMAITTDTQKLTAFRMICFIIFNRLSLFSKSFKMCLHRYRYKCNFAIFRLN